eukprot:UN15278
MSGETNTERNKTGLVEVSDFYDDEMSTESVALKLGNDYYPYGSNSAIVITPAVSITEDESTDHDFGAEIIGQNPELELMTISPKLNAQSTIESQDIVDSTPNIRHLPT